MSETQEKPATTKFETEFVFPKDSPWAGQVVIARFEMTADIGKLLEALAQAQGEATDAAMNKQNPHFRSRYADLSSCYKISRPLQAKYGLSVLVLPCGHEIMTMLGHKSGQWIRVFIPIPESQGRRPGIQELGSTLTYFRRYILNGVFGIAGDEDLDGNNQEQQETQYQRPQGPPREYDASQDERPVTAAQIKLIVTRQKNAEIPNEELKDWMVNELGIDSMKKLQRLHVDKVLNFIAGDR